MEKTKNKDKREHTTQNLWNFFEQNYPYVLIGKLGKGSYGSVMKVRNLENGQVFAAKLIMNAFDTIYQGR